MERSGTQTEQERFWKFLPQAFPRVQKRTAEEPSMHSPAVGGHRSSFIIRRIVDRLQAFRGAKSLSRFPNRSLSFPVKGHERLHSIQGGSIPPC